MDKKDYGLFAGSLFLLVFILHGIRILAGWDVVIAEWEVPMWVSWVAVFVTAYLSYTGLQLGGVIK